MTASQQNPTSASTSTEPLNKTPVSALTLLLKKNPPTKSNIASISQPNNSISSPKGNKSESGSLKMFSNTLGKTFNPLQRLKEKESDDQPFVLVNQDDSNQNNISRYSPETDWKLTSATTAEFFLKQNMSNSELSHRKSSAGEPSVSAINNPSQPINTLGITVTSSSPRNIYVLSNQPHENTSRLIPVGSIPKTVYLPSSQKVVERCHTTILTTNTKRI